MGLDDYFVLLSQDSANPVAAASAINISVVEEDPDTFEYTRYTFIGWLGVEVAERVGPLVTEGLIRLGASKVHWHSFNADYMGEWYLDLVTPTNLSAASSARVMSALSGLIFLPGNAWNAVTLM